MEQSIHIVNMLNRDKKREIGTEEERETGIEENNRKEKRDKIHLELNKSAKAKQIQAG